MNLNPEIGGFAKYKSDCCELVAVLASDEDSFEMLEDQIDMTIDFNDHFLERLHNVLQEQFSRVGCLVKIEVDEQAKGNGLGASMMDCFDRDIGSQTEVDILFARINNPQHKGFSLRTFYEKRGYEPIRFEDGSLLMANKGKASELIQLLGLHRSYGSTLEP
ncbi:hypothetical protein [Vibrio owensii]|uniref:hypothetical protein n=1 Tax=Vibrio harveyi group TaxID=717610 RepID=UPI003CC5B3B0